VEERRYNLKVAYVQGDDLLPRFPEVFADSSYEHFDSRNSEVQVHELTRRFERDNSKKFVSAHAYLGARGIIASLRAGADIVICGRVADASPVIGLAAWWHHWSDTDFDYLAGALIAGRKYLEK
jgi:hypothetical protein